jgi:hypothetical protein
MRSFSQTMIAAARLLEKGQRPPSQSELDRRADAVVSRMGGEVCVGRPSEQDKRVSAKLSIENLEAHSGFASREDELMTRHMGSTMAQADEFRKLLLRADKLVAQDRAGRKKLEALTREGWHFLHSNMTWPEKLAEDLRAQIEAFEAADK